jgi:hypothetical protein
MNRVSPPADDLSRAGRGAVGRLTAGVRCAAFWTAVAVTLAYAPLFALWSGQVPPDLLAGTVGLHTVALLAGHRHNRDADGED